MVRSLDEATPENLQPVVEVLDAQDGKTVASLHLATDDEQQAITTTEGIPDFLAQVTLLA